MKTIAQQLGVEDFPFTIKDAKGNEIYFETSDGYWEKNKFDSKGNKIYYEDSNSLWIERIFDSQGNELYYKDSNGYIKDYRNIPEYTMEELVKKIGNFKLKIK